MAKGKHAVNGRDSGGHSFGVKAFGGEVIPAGTIIVRQRGTNFLPGKNTGLGSNHTIFAKAAGIVKFTRTKADHKYVHVLPKA